MFPFVLIAVGLVLALSSNDSSEGEDACDTSIDSLPEPLRTAARDAALNGKDPEKLRTLAKMLRDNGKTRAAECIEARALVMAAFVTATPQSATPSTMVNAAFYSRLPASLTGFAPSAVPAPEMPAATPSTDSPTSGNSYFSNASTETSAPLEAPRLRIGPVPDNKG